MKHLHKRNRTMYALIIASMVLMCAKSYAADSSVDDKAGTHKNNNDTVYMPYGSGLPYSMNENSFLHNHRRMDALNSQILSDTHHIVTMEREHYAKTEILPVASTGGYTINEKVSGRIDVTRVQNNLGIHAGLSFSF